jgi:hypothetical protein
MTSTNLIAAVTPGLPLVKALAVFVAACNQPGTLYINDRWFATRREKLLALLSDPITEDETFLLREVLRRRLPFEVLFDFLTEKPISWKDYLRVKSEMREHRRVRTMAEGIFPWDDVEASRREPERHHPEGKAVPEPKVTATTCPCCSEPLTWIYFSTPPWTWEQKRGRAGWLGVCDECHLQVDFALAVMN